MRNNEAKQINKKYQTNPQHPTGECPKNGGSTGYFGTFQQRGAERCWSVPGTRELR